MTPRQRAPVPSSPPSGCRPQTTRWDGRSGLFRCRLTVPCAAKPTQPALLPFPASRAKRDRKLGQHFSDAGQTVALQRTATLFPYDSGQWVCVQRSFLLNPAQTLHKRFTWYPSPTPFTPASSVIGLVPKIRSATRGKWDYVNTHPPLPPPLLRGAAL